MFLNISLKMLSFKPAFFTLLSSTTGEDPFDPIH